MAVVVEIDEHSHVDYDASCEVKKISEQNLQIQHLEGCENIPVFTIRVNPDAYDQRRRSCVLLFILEHHNNPLPTFFADE